MKERLSFIALCWGAALWPVIAQAQTPPAGAPPDAPAVPVAPAAPPPPVAPPAPPQPSSPPVGSVAPPAPIVDKPPEPVTPPPAPLSREARIRELESKVERLSRAIAEMKAPPPPPVPVEPVPAAPPPLPNQSTDPLHGLVISGYVQAQLENHDDSEDQLRPGGVPLNQNRFLLRRGRLKVEREWEYSALMLEIDGNTNKGPAIGLFKAEASVFYRGGAEAPAPPLIKFTMGLFDTPFGYEMLESPRNRFFMERSLQSRAFFPTEPDLGARLSGEIGWFRYAFAVQNGEPLGTASGFALQDPNNHKDFIAHVGALAKVSPVEISGGLSVLNGKGFVKGTDATKNTVVWTDTGDDHKLSDLNELTPNPASSASPSYNFDRWAVGADLQFRLKTDAGWTKLYGELQLGSNMDRALFIANPTIGGQDARELGYYLGLVQEVTPYGVVGFRTDFYNPNADFLGYQSGKLIPVSESVRTHSPMVGLVLPGRARLVFQYDFIRDHYGRDLVGRPTDLKNDTWTLRLQGEL